MHDALKRDVELSPEQLWKTLHPLYKWREIKQQRDALLQETDWLVRRHQEQVESLRTLRQQEYTTLLEYRQALRDIPQTHKNPDSVKWPVAPDFLNDSGSTPSSRPAGAILTG